MRHYAIWDKKTPVITPIGEVLQPEEWIAKYPVAGLDNVNVVCAAGEINGAFFGTLGQMMQRYEDVIDFSQFETPDEKLAAMEAYDAEQAAIAATAAAEKEAVANINEELTATSLAAIAAAMEYQNMMTLDDIDEEDM